VKTKPRNWRQWAFVLIVVGYVQYIVLIAVAMHYYPGGTLSNHDTVGYLFWNNYTSDLSRRVSLSGDPNTISRSLYEVSQCILYLILCLFFIALPRLFSKAKSARLLANIGSVFGVIGAISMVIETFIPWDLHKLAMETFDETFNIAFTAALLLYIVAIFRDKLFPKVYAYVILAYLFIGACLPVIYFAFPHPEKALDNRLQSIAVVIVSYGAAVCVSIFAYGAWRVDKRRRELGTDSTLGKG